MKAQQDNGLTGNAWVKRVDEIRQMVNDNYDEGVSTPGEFVEYAVETYEAEFDAADIRIMKQEAERIAAK
jgi:hypothetical protein